MQSVYPDPATDKSQFWKRISCLTTHAYIVNYNFLSVLIKEGLEALSAFKKGVEGSPKSLSEWLCTKIHPKYKVYMSTPEFVIQTNGYSDVRKKEITYNQTLTETCGSLNNNDEILSPMEYKSIDQVPYNIVETPGDTAEAEVNRSIELKIDDI